MLNSRERVELRLETQAGLCKQSGFDSRGMRNIDNSDLSSSRVCLVWRRGGRARQNIHFQKRTLCHTDVFYTVLPFQVDRPCDGNIYTSQMCAIYLRIPNSHQDLRT